MTATLASPDIYLYNTAKREKELFIPAVDGVVNMYVCGVTVYDYSHIGHARAYTAFDTLYRFLEWQGYKVCYLRNFTDIDDKIIKRAALTGQSCEALTHKFIAEFQADMESLNCKPPTYEPRATHHIPDMITMIQSILKNGHGYVADGDVYLEVSTIPEYGSLSGRKQEDNRAGERVAVDERKRGPADFVLWKASKPGEPSWDSPWGSGRPGWHIECSAMIHRRFGAGGVDIHGGGRDLIFPHHENELAQSRASAGCGCGADHSPPANLARYWVHNGFVNVDNEKMSKSVGNFTTIRDILSTTHPMALRWLLLGAHYRSPLNFGPSAVDQATDRVYYLYQTLADAEDAGAAGAGEDATAGAGEDGAAPCETLTAVLAALADDLNTPAALAALSGTLREVNDLLKGGKRGATAGSGAALRALRARLLRALGPLGLDLAPHAVLGELRALALARAGLDEGQVQAAVALRAALRAARDYAGADAVREGLAARGVALMDDGKGGTAWRPLPLHSAAAQGGEEGV